MKHVPVILALGFRMGIGAVAFSLRADAGLSWEQTTIEQEMPAGSDLIEVKFKFTNRESHPVRILQLQPSCGCTTPTVEKYSFAPGEKGAVTALFDARGLGGTQEKMIVVGTDDNPNPTVLGLNITIPPWLEVSPRLIWWAVGDEPKTREAIVTLNPAAHAKITSVKVDGSDIEVKFEPDESKAGQHRLIAKPHSTVKPVQTTVTITVEVPGSSSRRYPVFVQVR